MTRVGVLVSGSGTNLQALIDDAARPDAPYEIAVVLCNRPSAGALARAERAGIPREVLRQRDFPSREAFDAGLAERLAAHAVDWVACAGFMRVLTPTFLRQFPGRVLNIHPSLLPSFPGLHAQAQAIERRVAIAGCTVHFVDEGVDTGPIIAQAAVPVLPGDDASSLGARILTQEHRLYPQVLRWAARGELGCVDGVVTTGGARQLGLQSTP